MHQPIDEEPAKLLTETLVPENSLISPPNTLDFLQLGNLGIPLSVFQGGGVYGHMVEQKQRTRKFKMPANGELEFKCNLPGTPALRAAQKIIADHVGRLLKRQQKIIEMHMLRPDATELEKLRKE